MDEDEKIDEEKQRAQVDYVIVGSVTGILAFGSNGEFYMLEEDEMEHGLRIIVDRTAGRLRHRGHQRQKVLPPGQNGRGKRHSGGQRAAAHVLKADPR